MGRIRARMMLSTTPNIGSPGFPLARPRYIDNLAHVCHAVSGLGNYHRYSLDSYDTVLMPGEFMREEVRQIERLRGLPEKSCVSVGLPYLDVLAAKASARRARPSASPVILIAPSWGSKNFLRVCGSDFISAITQENYQVIIRPHPHSWIAEPEFLRELEKKIAGCSNAWIDREVDGSESLNRADLLISGRSAVRFDFAFLYEKPVLSVKLPLEDMREYEFSDLGEIWEDRAQYLLGPVIEPDADAELILAKISEALKFTPRSISELREQTVANFGSSSQVIASWCLGQLQEAQ
ncbi:MAG: CDP-glycerol glycerophosphotransferase family protein [Pseudomonadota bacterium]